MGLAVSYFPTNKKLCTSLSVSCLPNNKKMRRCVQAEVVSFTNRLKCPGKPYIHMGNGGVKEHHYEENRNQADNFT
jgi:hypothetical protein